MSSRVLIVATNRVRTPFPVGPLGASAIASAARRAGHDVSFLDLMFERWPQRALRRAIRAGRPQIIGLSIRNMDTTAWLDNTFFLDEARQYVDIAWEAKVPVVVGGGCVGVNPLPVLGYLGAEIGVVGEGELSFVELVAHLEQGRSFDHLPGIAVVRPADGVARLNPPHRVSDMGTLPRPQTYRWTPIGAYARRHGALQVQTRRGCALDCTYCNYPELEGNRYRTRPIDDVVAELAELAAAEPDVPVEFVDSTFNVPLQYTVDLCEAIAEAGLDLSLSTSGFYPGAVTPRLLDAMQRAGFQQIIVSPDSASDAVLKRMGKGITRAALEEFATQRKGMDFSVLWSFMLGGPGETEETLEQTFDFIDRFVPESDMVYFQLGIRVYPNTRLQRQLVDEGTLAADDPLLEPLYYFSPGVDGDRLVGQVSRFIQSHPAVSTVQDMEHPMFAMYMQVTHWLGDRNPMRGGAEGLRRLTSVGLRRGLRDGAGTVISSELGDPEKGFVGAPETAEDRVDPPNSDSLS